MSSWLCPWLSGQDISGRHRRYRAQRVWVKGRVAHCWASPQRAMMPLTGRVAHGTLRFSFTSLASSGQDKHAWLHSVLWVSAVSGSPFCAAAVSGQSRPALKAGGTLEAHQPGSFEGAMWRVLS